MDFCFFTLNTDAHKDKFVFSRTKNHHCVVSHLFSQASLWRSPEKQCQPIRGVEALKLSSDWLIVFWVRKITQILGKMLRETKSSKCWIGWDLVPSLLCHIDKSHKSWQLVLRANTTTNAPLVLTIYNLYKMRYINCNDIKGLHILSNICLYYIDSNGKIMTYIWYIHSVTGPDLVYLIKKPQYFLLLCPWPVGWWGCNEAKCPAEVRLSSGQLYSCILEGWCFDIQCNNNTHI